MRLTFVASLPPIQGAVKIDGRGDGARVQLDIPASHTLQAMQLAVLGGKALTVTVEVDEPSSLEGSHA